MAAARILPKVHRKLVAVSLSNRFRDAVQLQTAETPRPGRGELLVRVRHVGINASDINWTAGRYVPGIQPPMDVGFEGLGEVAAVGEKCEAFKPGDVVGFMQSVGAFSEYFLLRARHALPMARLDPALIPLMVSGLTASISLERMADMKAGEKVPLLCLPCLVCICSRSCVICSLHCLHVEDWRTRVIQPHKWEIAYLWKLMVIQVFVIQSCLSGIFYLALILHY